MMLRVVLKEFYHSRKVLLLALAIGLFFVASMSAQISDGSGNMIGGFVLMIVFSVVTTNEHNEARNKGYYLLRTLPIKEYKIVAGKFLTAFLIMILGVGYIFMIVSIYPGADIINMLFVNTIMSNASMTLTFIGIFYVLVYRIGPAKAINLSRVIFFLLFFSPVLFNLLMDKLGLGESYSEILGRINISGTYMMVLFSITIYLICLTTSIGLFKKYKFY